MSNHCKQHIIKIKLGMAVAAHLLLRKRCFLGARQQGLQKSAASVHAQINSLAFLGFFSNRDSKMHSYLSSWKEKYTDPSCFPLKYENDALLLQPLFQFFCSRYTVKFCILLSFRWIPRGRVKETSQATTMQRAGGPLHPQTRTQTRLVFSSCCVSCESQLAVERFFQMCALVIGTIQSLWKAVETLPLIFMVLCHLLQLRSHPCSPLLRFQEILKSSTTYFKEHQMWDGVAKLPKIYFTAGCKSRWQAQQTALLCSSSVVLPESHRITEC